MPEEFQAIDRRYRIKSDHEGFERNVMECDLNETVGRSGLSAKPANAPKRRPLIS